MTAAAIKGTFSEFKAIKTRSVVQVIIEIPVESADHALKALGGWPQAGEERWVAVALLDPGKLTSGPETASEVPYGLTRYNTEKPQRSWHGLALSNQAGIACDDPRFQTFLEEERATEMMTATIGASADDPYAETVRLVCGVSSRSKFDTDEEAGKRWTALYGEFQAWKELGE